MKRPVDFALLTIFSIIVCIAVFAFFTSRSRTVNPQSGVTLSEPAGKASVNVDETEQDVSVRLIGGVKRPATDVRFDAKTEDPSPKILLKIQGPNPIVATDLNEQTKGISDAIFSKSKDARLASSGTVANTFDREAYEANPSDYVAAYASKVEPGRVFAPAEPGEGVTPVGAVSERFHRVQQGESVKLSVKATKLSPVTFTSFGMGQFENHLSSTTTIADADGVASAIFLASTGTIGEVPILAGSPLDSGNVRFVVAVQTPDK
jgi:hypothetical protein